ncbi:hypothetical protein TWF694_005366 [Orbilia ellipsospora]|uniref:Secreted protein n=1 Tax=Orbilia ellipsospora TaxID=2528407 RepID=A0AAV9WSV6_9PEZI
MTLKVYLAAGAYLWSVAAAIQLVPSNFTTPLLSKSCLDALHQSVACNNSLTWATSGGRFEYDDTLKHLCQNPCQTALTTWTKKVASDCKSSWFNTANGYAMSPSYFPELYLELYNYACLKDSSGKFCNSVLRDLIGIDPAGQNITKSACKNFNSIHPLPTIIRLTIFMRTSANRNTGTMRRL